MKSIFIFLSVIYICQCAVIYNQTVLIYQDDLDNLYTNYEEYPSNAIKNAEEYHVYPGRALISFELLNHNIYLTNYKPLPDLKEERNLGAYSPMYGKTLLVGIYRAADRKKTTCMSVDAVKRYRRYVELGVKLWTGNQVRLNTGDDEGYISSQCLEVEDKWYNPEARGALEAQLMAKAIAADGDKAKTWATRWFITDWFGGGWEGLAVVGSPSAMVNKNTNYWLFVQDNYYGNEDANMGRLSTIMHEYTHNLGFSHSNTVGADYTGQFYHFKSVDGYGDCGSYMGNCASWTNPPCMSSYRFAAVGNKPEPWQFKTVANGKHTYRLYAMDHPYSRHVLGPGAAYHKDNEVFDGVEFRYFALALEIVISKDMTSKFTGGDNYAAINLEYRINDHGLSGAKTNGVRVTYAVSWTSEMKNNLCNVLHANVDQVGSWEDSEIPFGTIYYPKDIDTGTLTIQIKKVHRSIMPKSLEEMILENDKRDYLEAPYVDIEINYQPKVAQNRPSGKVKKQTFKFSPSWFNCKLKDDGYGYDCQRSTSTGSGWGYLEDEPERVAGPRIYTNQLKYYQPIYGFRSYTGKQTLLWIVCYGTTGRVCPRININDAKLTDINLKVYQFATIKRMKNVENATEEYYKDGIVLYGEGVTVPAGGSIYVTDLYYGEQKLTVKDGKFFTVLPNLETEGLGEGAVVIKDKSGTVVSYKVFVVCRDTNSERITVDKVEKSITTTDGNTTTTTTDISYTIGVAAIDKGRYTTNSMILKQTIHANTWFVYPIMDLAWNDYFYVDFGGRIPSGLTMTIEVDSGHFVVDLFELEGHDRVSYKLSYLELNEKMGCLCDVYKFKFSKAVEIVNIRGVHADPTGNTIRAIAATTGSIVYDGYKYNIETKATGEKFSFQSFSMNIDGKSYSFTSTGVSYPGIKIKPIHISSGSSSTVIITIVVVVVVLVLIIGVYCYIKKKKMSNAQRAYNSSSRPPMINPAYNPASRPPPIVNPAYGRTMAPRGYGGTMAPRGYPAAMPPRAYGGTMPPRGYTGGYSR